MRKIILALLGTLSGLVLLFSYHTSTDQQTTSAASSGAVPTGAASPGGSVTSSAAPAASTSASETFKDGTYTGAAAGTRWGTVQVEITVSGGRITSAQTVQQPDGNSRDQEINSFAVPNLNSEVVSAQSASIDMVSGATVTSTGYVQSLQSAIDKAKA